MESVLLLSLCAFWGLNLGSHTTAVSLYLPHHLAGPYTDVLIASSIC